MSQGTRLASAAFAALVLAAGTAGAQGYPSRPVTVVVPFAAGGTSDITTRIIAQSMSESLGRQIVVENRPGASGAIGWNHVAKAAPDGYTLLAIETSFSMAPGLIPTLPFNPRADFVHLSVTAGVPFVMVIHPSVAAKSVAEFVALAKAQPGKLNYGSAGNGTSTHLGAEWFRSFTQVDMLHVPFKGGGPANQAVLANQVQMAFPAVPSALGFIRGGKLRALMVTAAQRNASLPDVASAPEAGLPKMVGDNWFAFSAPAKTPADILATLHKEVLAALARPAVRERFGELGLNVIGSSPAQAARQIDEEIERWSALVRSAGIKAD